LLTPDGSHLGEGVALDHRLARPYELMNLWGGGRPIQLSALKLKRLLDLGDGFDHLIPLLWGNNAASQNVCCPNFWF
jgi:hypothetical protein